MKSAYQIIRQPVITEKGLGVKETEATLVFEVAAKATKTEIKQAVQQHFQGEGGYGAHREFRGQGTAPRQVYRLSSRLEEGVRAAEGGREDARVRREPLTQPSQRVG